MKIFVSVLICLCLSFWVFGAGAQTTEGKNSRPSPPAAPLATAPPAYSEISGMYTFLREGEFVQITVGEQGKVTGFLSRFGDRESDQGTFLDQFFKTGTLDGSKLSFTTQPLHGMWYEFRGTVSRGDGKSPDDEAYYVLKGTLTEYVTDADRQTTSRSQPVTLKKFPQDVSMDHPKGD